MPNSSPRIAIIRLSALGDIVNSAVVLQLIKLHLPNARITWIVEEAFAPLLEHHPMLEKVVALPMKRLKKERSPKVLATIVSTLRRLGPYDHVIDMQGLLKSAIVGRLCGARLHGFDRRSIKERAASYLYASHSAIAYEANIITRNCRVVADALGFTCNPEEIAQKEPLFPTVALRKPLFEGVNIAIVIGASWPSKRYPNHKIVSLCEALPHPCHLVWGTPQEYDDALWIAAQCPNAHVAPKMDLAQLVSFIAACDLTIGNDTGPTHMAWAMNRASITLFGPTSGRMIGLTPHNIAIEARSDVDVRRIDRHDRSIMTIEVESIVHRALELL
ncbi:MAG: lipopolysaccharide heptosyltransferase I [Campylobacterales bacterium]|nr:lipopolysaccharide heptosyltransferase I [Campylobacterales bacterium]